MTTEEIIEKSRKETAEHIKVLQAFVDGKTIEERRISFDHTEWVDNNNPEWRWDKFDYRIKPESKYRPFRTTQECLSEMLKHQPFGWLKPINKCTNNSITINISSIGYNDEYPIQFTNDYGDYSFEYLYKEFTFMDGTPFGIVEKD